MSAEDYGDQYDVETFLRRVLSVVDPALRRRQVERHLTTVDAPTVAAHIHEVLERSTTGDERANAMLLPLIAVVDRPDGANAFAVEAVNLEARAQGLATLSWWLLDPPPFRAIDPRQVKHASSASQSLGHRRAAAATSTDPRELERLALDDHPMVVDRVCANPRTQESHIMAVVTRRPTRPDVLDAVALHARWLQRLPVRESLVMNPFARTGLALRLLPTLGGPRWASIRHAGQVHPAVSAFAAHLCRVRDGEEVLEGPESLAETRH